MHVRLQLSRAGDLMMARSTGSMVNPLSTVHVITTCADRKTRAPAVRAGALPCTTLTERMEAWRCALTIEGEPVAASKLYAGDHWQAAKGLPSDAPNGVAVRLWVCSAGYGLIESETPLTPYAATFDSTHADAVAPRGVSFSTADWWNALTEWKLEGSSVRSIAALARLARVSGEAVLLAVSEQYLAAISEDAATAANILGDRLLLISAGARTARLRSLGEDGAVLAAHLLPTDASMKAVVGGAMQSLNVRLARHALRVADKWVTEPSMLRSLFAQWVAEAPPIDTYDRARSNDATLRHFIRASLDEDPTITHTNLLRTLRFSGRACEQSRFRALFREVRDEMGLPARRLPSRSAHA